LNLLEQTNYFQTLDSIVDFTKKIELIKSTGEANLEIAQDPILTISTKLGDYHLVYTLLNLGADINVFRKSKYAFGNTALIEASKYGFVKIVKLLIEYGADLDARNYMGNSALMVATLNRNIEVVRILIENGATVDLVDKNNDTPLLIASAKGYFEIVELLLKAQANIHHVDFDNENAFILAMNAGNYKTIELIKQYI